MADTIEQLKHEHEVVQEAEGDARHVMGAVLVIDVSVVLFVMVCIAAALVAVLR